MSDELRARAAAVCRALLGAEVSDPWSGGHDPWKVGGKMFACIGAITPGVAVKCPALPTAELLIETGVGSRAPYFHRSCVLLREAGELDHRLRGSYALVRDELTKKVQAQIAMEAG